MSLDNERVYRALLNAVLKRDYEDNTSLTGEVVKQELNLESCTVEEVSSLMTLTSQLLKKGAEDDLAMSPFEAEARKQGLTETQVVAATKFWKANKEKILNVVRKRSTWNDSLSKFAWRIDIKSRVRMSNEELNEATSIMELNIKQPNNKDNEDGKIIRFEMNKDQLLATLHQVNDIQKVIDEIAQK